MSVTERFSDLSVLLVDDHALIRQACRELLQRAGVARFFEAADGEEAYRIFVEQAPSLVVLDLLAEAMVENNVNFLKKK